MSKCLFQPGTVIGGATVIRLVTENRKDSSRSVYLVETHCCGRVYEITHKALQHREQRNSAQCMRCRYLPPGERKQYSPPPINWAPIPTWTPTTAGLNAPRWR